MNVGIDIVDINKFSTLIEKYNSKFLKRVFSKTELDEWKSRGKRLSLLAGRFATKEAFIKATNYKGALNQIEVIGTIPKIRLKNKMLDSLKLSISHTEDLATSIVIIE